LGGFVLNERLGVGGMSEVWRANHLESGFQVAVKLIGASIRSPGDPTATAPRRDQGLQRAAADAMRQEISLLSRLDHPGILRVLSFGTVELDEAHASDGELLPESPYLVTPWARSGSLDRSPPPEDWPALRGILRALLLALAHAHARGVVHRDLKPANVLLIGDPSEGPLRPVLSDFGIAFALLRAQRSMTPSADDQLGTPAYMAPEQVLGPPMEQGPAMDLYALGCLAFRLASGRPPFVGPTDEVLRAHALLPPPNLRANLAVPEGFAEWVAVLLAKEPHQRFPSAAAARHALEALDVHSSEWVPPRSTSAPPPQPRTTPDAVTAQQAQQIAIRRSIVPEPLQIRASLFPPAPPPLTWRELDALSLPSRSRRSSAPGPAHDSGPPRPSLPDFELADAGLGLFGFRRLDLIGRERERDLLYAQLMAVTAEGMSRAVVLRGPFGMGTTRLGEWLLEIASELDVGQPLHIEAGQSRSPGDAVVELLVRLLGAEGMNPAQQATRTRAWAKDAALSPSEADDLLAVLERRQDRFAYPSERYAAVRRALSRASLRVPLVVFLDDAVVDPDAMALLASCIESEEPLSALFVLSVSSELLELGASFSFSRGPSLRRLLELPRVTELSIGPLPPDEQGELVQELLGLAPELAREVVERSEGRPLFAFQLVGDWVARGLLLPGLFGFTLREGTDAEVPDGIHALLRRRLDEARDAIAARTSFADAEEALIGLELAALLSPAPSSREWHAVLDAAQIRAAQSLPELAARGLIRPQRDRIVIAHRMLRETLYRRAKEGGRYAAHHRVIARALAPRDVDPSRLAYHYLESGDLSLALDPLCASAERRCARSDWTGALEALRQHVDALDALGAPPDDPRRIRGRLLRAEVLGHGVLLDEASLALEQAELGLRAMPAALPERSALEARWMWLRGVFAQKRGQAREALGWFERSLVTLFERLEELGPSDRELLARAYYGVAEASKLLGDLGRALAAYAAALTEAGASHRLGPLVLTGISDLECRRGNIERARELGQQALDLLEARGARHDAAITRNALGDIERKQGHLAAAEAHYLAASAQLGELGSGDAAFARMNLALLSIARGDYVAARLELDAAERAFTAQARAGYAGCVAVMRVPGFAAEGNARAVARVLDDQGALLETLFDPDLLWCLERALLIGVGLPGELMNRIAAAAHHQREHLTRGAPSG
jgi:serine/threonine protein kinase/tetratricopeptide (TPR) repeat protein